MVFFGNIISMKSGSVIQLDPPNYRKKSNSKYLCHHVEVDYTPMWSSRTINYKGVTYIKSKELENVESVNVQKIDQTKTPA